MSKINEIFTENEITILKELIFTEVRNLRELKSNRFIDVEKVNAHENELLEIFTKLN